MEVLFLFFSLLFDLYYDISLFSLCLLLVMLTFYIIIGNEGRRREWDLFLFAAFSGTKARERIWQVLKRSTLATLYYRLFMHRRRRSDFLTMTVAIRRTILARRSILRTLEQVSRKLASASRLRLRSTAKPDGSKDLLDTFEAALGGTLCRLFTARLAMCETKLVCLVHTQESAFFPAPGKRVNASGTHRRA